MVVACAGFEHRGAGTINYCAKGISVPRDNCYTPARLGRVRKGVVIDRVLVILLSSRVTEMETKHPKQLPPVQTCRDQTLPKVHITNAPRHGLTLPIHYHAGL